MLLDVNECCSIALTGEPYSNVPWGLRWSRLGDVCCGFSRIRDVQYIYFSGHSFFSSLKDEHFKSQTAAAFMNLILPMSPKKINFALPALRDFLSSVI